MDIAVDKDGAFYVSEVYVEQDRLGRLDLLSEGEHRVSILDENGEILCRWDAALAHGIWVDSRGDIYPRRLRSPNHPQIHPPPLTPSPYRGNASFTPASTGSIAPVVFDDRGPARKSTASATSSPVTLRFNKFR